MVRPIPRSVLDVLQSQAHPPAVANTLQEGQIWRREEEQDINAIRPPDDEAFLVEKGDNMHVEDLLFSDGFPLIADDDTKSGRGAQTRQPFE